MEFPILFWSSILDDQNFSKFSYFLIFFLFLKLQVTVVLCNDRRLVGISNDPGYQQPLPTRCCLERPAANRLVHGMSQWFCILSNIQVVLKIARVLYMIAPTTSCLGFTLFLLKIYIEIKIFPNIRENTYRYCVHFNMSLLSI